MTPVPFSRLTHSDPETNRIVQDIYDKLARALQSPTTEKAKVTTTVSDLVGARSYQSSPQTIVAGADTPLTFALNDFAFTGVRQTSLSRFVAVESGVYLAMCQVAAEVPEHVGSKVDLLVRTNGDTETARNRHLTLSPLLKYIQVVDIVKLSKGDFIEFLLSQDSTGPATTHAADTWGSLVKIGV